MAMMEQFMALVAGGATELDDEHMMRLIEDAARYRWLREQQAVGCWPQVVDGLYRLSGNELDVAVDDAMFRERGRLN
jgi:hypothetical protein